MKRHSPRFDYMGRFGVVANHHGDRCEALSELIASFWKIRQLELDPQKEASSVGIGAVLVGVNDVCAIVEEKRRDCGDDARAIRTRHQQSAEIGHGLYILAGSSEARFGHSHPVSYTH